jgi:hypothetical protein
LFAFLVLALAPFAILRVERTGNGVVIIVQDFQN